MIQSLELFRHNTSGHVSCSWAATDGNCISAKSDQFLSEPLISRQDDPASLWWKMNMHRFPQLSPLAQKFLAPPPTSVPLLREAFRYSWWHYIWPPLSSSTRKCRDIDLEVQQPPLGRVTFLNAGVTHFESFWLRFYFMFSFWTCAIKIYHLMLIIDNAKWLIWLTLTLVLLCVELNSQNPVPALAGFEFTNPARSGSGRIWISEIRYIPSF